MSVEVSRPYGTKDKVSSTCVYEEFPQKISTYNINYFSLSISYSINICLFDNDIMKYFNLVKIKKKVKVSL